MASEGTYGPSVYNKLRIGRIEMRQDPLHNATSRGILLG